jgi:hypothetical protein
MGLTPAELDALLKFLEHQWMPDAVQRAYDKLAEEQRTRLIAEQRLATLERRLREAAAEPRPAPRETAGDPDAESASGDANREKESSQ